MSIRNSTNPNLGEDFLKGKGGGATPNSVVVPEIKVPGVTLFSPEKAAALTPAFNPDVYENPDPLHPPEFPGVTVAELNQGMSRYEHAERGLQLHLKGQQVAGQVFDVVKERGKTLNKGFQAATAWQDAKTAYIDNQIAVEETKQGVISYKNALHKTSHEAEISTLTQFELDQQIEQGKLQVASTQWKLNQAKDELALLKQSLGRYATVDVK